MSRRAQRLRQGFLLAHRWGGLVAGLVLLVVAVTGTLLVFEKDLDRALHPELWRADATLAPRPLAEIAAAARAAHPDLELRQMIVRAGAGQPVEARFTGGRHAFVDPGSGALLGTVHRPYSFFGVVERLHTSLCVGEAGKWIVGLSTLMMVVLLGTGLWLWWPKQWKQLKGAVSLALHRKGRALHFNLHNTLGFWTALPLLVIALTGSVMAFKPLGAAVRAIGGGPDAKLAPPVAMSDATLPVASPDAVFTAAVREFPAWAEMRLHFPRTMADEHGYEADHEPGYEHQLWRAEVVVFGAKHEHARSKAWFDPRTAEVLRVDYFAALPIGARLRALMRPIHDGSILGRPTQVIALLSVLMIPVLSVTGFVLWWLRTRAQRARNHCVAARLVRIPAAASPLAAALVPQPQPITRHSASAL